MTALFAAQLGGAVLAQPSADAATARHLLITDSAAPTAAVLIDGHGYVRRGE